VAALKYGGESRWVSGGGVAPVQGASEADGRGLARAGVGRAQGWRRGGGAASGELKRARKRRRTIKRKRKRMGRRREQGLSAGWR